jgi:hypothetical protein
MSCEYCPQFCSLDGGLGCHCPRHELGKVKTELSQTKQKLSDQIETSHHAHVRAHGQGQEQAIKDIVEWLEDGITPRDKPAWKIAKELKDGSWHKEIPQAPVCSLCQGKEQLWGVKLVQGTESRWLMLSAFLHQWAGVQMNALEEANSYNAKVFASAGKLNGVAVAEQLICLGCGKTNNPKEK